MNNNYKTWAFLLPGTCEDIVADQIDAEKILDDMQNRLDKINTVDALKGLSPDLQERMMTLKELNMKIMEQRNQIAKVRSDAQLNPPSTKNILINNYLLKLQKLTKKQDDKIKEYVAFSTAGRLGTIVNNYKPTQPVEGMRVQTLQGVGTSHLNPLQMTIEGLHKNKKVPAALLGIVAGKGEKQNIEFCLHELAKANPLPERIVLNGHSRGACACIELARAIYIKYGEAIKIAININDPVPGPGRHAKTKMVIPPCVDSLVITYAGKDRSPLLKPLDLREIHFDPEKTTVTTTALTTTHSFNINQEEAFSALKSINSHMLSSINGESKDLSIEERKNLQKLSYDPKDPKKNLSSTRQDCVFCMATDPQRNDNLSPDLAAFHESIQAQTNHFADINTIRGKNRHLVSHAVRNMDPESAPTEEKRQQERELLLDVIYHTSKKSLTISNDKIANDLVAFAEWKRNLGADTQGLMDLMRQASNNLREEAHRLRSRDNSGLNGRTQHHTKERADIVDYVSKVLAVLVNKMEEHPDQINHKEIYQTIRVLMDYIDSQGAKLGSMPKADVNKALGFFHLPKIESKTNSVLINTLSQIVEPARTSPASRINR